MRLLQNASHKVNRLHAIFRLNEQKFTSNLVKLFILLYFTEKMGNRRNINLESQWDDFENDDDDFISISYNYEGIETFSKYSAIQCKNVA